VERKGRETTSELLFFLGRGSESSKQGQEKGSGKVGLFQGGDCLEL